jgi:hypothetical protein
MDIQTTKLLVTIAILATFSYFYNLFIEWLQNKEYFFEGMTSLQVIFGVAVTILAYALYRWDWQILLELGLLFAGSGSFMTLGNLWRFSKGYQKFKTEQIEIIKDDK